MADNSILAAYLASKQLAGGSRDPRETARARFAASLMQQGSDVSPVRSWGEGLARALQGGIGGLVAGYSEGERLNTESGNQKALAEYLSTGNIGALSGVKGELGNTIAAQLASQKFEAGRTQQGIDAFGVAHRGGAAPPVASAGPTGGVPQPGYAAANSPGSVNGQAIAGIESNGQPNGGYGAVGPTANAQGNRAYGKYQVLDTNIGPWTQEVTGKAMSPQEFLANPEAQDKVFEAKFGQYVTKYGSPQAASRAWFAGEGGMNNPKATDVNGMSVAQYENKFNQGILPGTIAQPPAQMAQGSGGDGTGTPVPTPSAASGPPDVPRPRPTDAQIEKYQRLMAGPNGLTRQQAEQGLEKEVTDELQMRRQQSLETWKDQQQSKRQNEKAAIDLGQKAPMEMIARRVDAYEKDIRPRAEAATSEINSIHQVRQLLDAGVFTGTGAEAQAAGSRIAQALGFDWGADKQANTAALQAAVGNRVLSLVKNLGAGAGISNADRDYAAKIAGGDIAVGEPAMRKILDIGERAARQVLKTHDTEAARLQRLPGLGQLGSDQFSIQAAPTYEEWSKANPLPQAQGAPAQTPGAPASPQAGGDVLAQAMDAIAKGAPRDAVIKRLQSMGINPEGL